MNAKDYLESVRMVQCDIERTIARIRRVESQLEVHGISYDGDRITRDGDDRITMGIIDLLDYHEYLKAMQSYYIKQEKEADYIIASITDASHRRAISLRYMDGLSYAKIGERMNYSPEGARKLCERAVGELDGMLIPLLQELSKLTEVAIDT